ncbi:MAG: IS200/IS605 family element transposase accessory protein TnpB [Thaumarchaeota archaeon]|nr:IS200/IS605 family element transposase accessory protein TnpB [Nitrososphaerota archaeon]
MKGVKSVQFTYRPTEQTQELLETFRMMVNHAIHISLEEGIKGRLNLRNRIYKEFQEKYGVISCYPYSVAEVAWSIVKKHKRWQRRPFASRLMMKMDASNYSLNYAILSIPFKKGQRICIPLEYGDYQRSFLMDMTLKRGSVTLTARTISISFSRRIAETEPMSKVGYDLNEKSIVGSDGTKYGLSEVARLHTEYGVRRRDFYEKHPRDERPRRKFSEGSRERNRVKQFLNRVSKAVVEKARANKQAIILERPKGIRRVHQKGNGEGRERRRRISQWPFRMLQQQIAYKAAWAGVPVEFVDPRNTSKTCSDCGFINRKLKLTEREWRCPSCGVNLDRDLNAAVNIERLGKIPCLPLVRAGAEGRGSDEGEREQREATLILRADAFKEGLQACPED